MGLAHTITTDGSKPTWSLVVVLVLTLAAETGADFLKEWWQRKPPEQPAMIDWEKCWAYCEGRIAVVARDSCTCRGHEDA